MLAVIFANFIPTKASHPRNVFDYARIVRREHAENIARLVTEAGTRKVELEVNRFLF